MSLKSYYLHQMGITEWVRRDLKPLNQKILVIVVEGGLSEKENSFLEKMLHSIELMPKDYFMVHPTEMNHESFQASLIRYKPKAILKLEGASKPSAVINHTGMSIPIISSLHPAIALTRPIEKKQIYTDLRKLISQLSA